MPFDSQVETQGVAAFDRPATHNTSATQTATMSSAIARYSVEECTAGLNECWPFRPAALPTDDDLRYADTLRLQLRQRYLGHPVPQSRAWDIGVD